MYVISESHLFSGGTITISYNDLDLSWLRLKHPTFCGQNDHLNRLHYRLICSGDRNQYYILKNDLITRSVLFYIKYCISVRMKMSDKFSFHIGSHCIINTFGSQTSDNNDNYAISSFINLVMTITVFPFTCII